jgi:EAL domain-containing protein (putative c-di-GMP-specific phosphodiesterase class I)
MLEDLQAAIDTGALNLHYQPVVDLASGELAGVEALVRWDDPERGHVPPSAFLPEAEASGLIGRLTASLLGAALDQCVAWRRGGLELPVAVNLSAHNVTDATLPAYVAGELERRNLPAALLRLELTETVLMDRPTTAAKTLGELRELGVTLALDDFGTGYSSLAYLARLPLDELKIDRGFIRELGDPRGLAITRAIVALAGELGLRTVAEGVEDAEALEQVRALGCDLAQGFHLARPLSASGLRLWLDRRAQARRSVTT